MATTATGAPRPGVSVGPTSEFSLFFRVRPGCADMTRADAAHPHGVIHGVAGGRHWAPQRPMPPADPRHRHRQQPRSAAADHGRARDERDRLRGQLDRALATAATYQGAPAPKTTASAFLWRRRSPSGATRSSTPRWAPYSPTLPTDHCIPERQIRSLLARVVILAVIPPGPTAPNQTALSGMPSQRELPRPYWTGLSGR